MQKQADKNRQAAVYLHYKMALDSVLRDAQELYQAFGLLRRGIVATQLVDYPHLEASFQEVKSTANFQFAIGTSDRNVIDTLRASLICIASS